VHLVEFVQEQGDSFDEGIATAHQAVLISPHFLFRIEQDRFPAEAGTFAPVSHYELASRLSYFIWSTMPDAELLQLASENRLRQPEVLTQQVRRMLRDEKSRALVENFAGQWLQFSNIEVLDDQFTRSRIGVVDHFRLCFGLDRVKDLQLLIGVEFIEDVSDILGADASEGFPEVLIGCAGIQRSADLLDEVRGVVRCLGQDLILFRC
jgi:hypothetical protein